MTSEVNSKVVFVLVYLKSDLPTLDRGKSADSWKKNKNKQKQKNLEILQKVVRFYFFPQNKIKQTFFPLGELTVYLNITLIHLWSFRSNKAPLFLWWLR